jgi:dTDP-4-amino-4,6-dideoxygalactose transaminase
VRVLPYDGTQRANYQYVVTEIDPALCPIARDRLLDVLWAENVMARRYFYPGCHRMQPYRSMNPDAWRHLPQTERISSRVLVLPTGETVSADDVSTVCGIIRLAIEHGDELADRLARTEPTHSSVLAS